MSLISKWNHFWFQPVHPGSLGVMRISLGLMLAASHLMLWPDLVMLYGPEGPVPTNIVTSGSYRWSYLDYIGNDEALHMVHGAGLIVFLLFALGWRTRTMAWLALLIQVAYHHRNPWCQHGGDRVFRLMTLYMALAPTGAAMSIDALRRKIPVVPPILSHRLIQLQLMVIYLFSGIEKVHGSSWLNGTANYYALATRNFQRFPGLLDPILSSAVGQWAIMATTWITVVWELAFTAMVLWKPTRRWALWIGVGVHVGIAATMMVGSFSFIMMWAYLAFVDPDKLGAWGEQKWESIIRRVRPQSLAAREE